MTTAVQTLTIADYDRVFAKECAKSYPVVDMFEQRCRVAIDRNRLEVAASVLACPIKKNDPNWQHGRVIYARVRQYLADRDAGFTKPSTLTALDIGTAKGFSALCLLWAFTDAGESVQVTSVDVIDPDARVQRNTVSEVHRLKTLGEILAPWPESKNIRFVQSTGIAWLESHPDRIHVAFVDGKHSGHVVRREGVLLSERQKRGDLAIFDDVHIPDVSVAVNSLNDAYRLEYLEVLPNRHYAIGVRR